MSVKIEVDIPVGRVIVEREMVLTIADTGKAQLAETLVEAANSVLRSYGIVPSIRATTARERLIEETPRGGW